MTATAPSLTACHHCGLSVPSGLVAQSGPSFCCAGCQAVFMLLTEARLEQYYERRESPPQQAIVSSDGTKFSRLDQAEFEARAVSRLSDGTCTVELGLEGIHCSACVWLIERLPRLEPAVLEARVDLGQRIVSLRYQAEKAKLSQIARGLAQLGYLASPLVAGHARESMKRERRDLWTRMGVAFASAGNAMLMAFALYSADFGEGPASMSPSYRRLFEVGSLLVSLPALWASLLFFRGALGAARARTVHLDLPIALGISAAYAYGTWGVFVSGRDLYFDSITILIFLLLFGRYLQNKHQSTYADALELASTVTPEKARRLSHVDALAGSGVELSTHELVPGDVVEVLCGETIPLDGHIVHGCTDLNLSLLSGESAPVAVGPGDAVFAGGINQTRRIVVRVEQRASESRAALLMRSVEQALASRAPMLLTIDRWAGPFTLGLIGLALAIGLTATTLHGVEEGIRRALSILVVACPCALSMATPLALSAAIGQAARRQMLIKGTGTVEALGTPSLIVFDKTGTLTEGQLRVVQARGDDSVLGLVAQAELESNHPVARALARDLGAGYATPSCGPLTVVEHSGSGLEVHSSAGTYWIGSRRFLSHHGIALSNDDLIEPDTLPGSCLSPTLIGYQDQLVGVVWLDDPIREDARNVLLRLKGLGHRLAILSGDRSESVEQVRRSLDPDGKLFEFAEGGHPPEEKLHRIDALTRKGPTVMIGDGVNDAAALARARVGVAVSGAAEASMLSADVYLANAGLERVYDLMNGSRRALDVVRRGLGISLIYNVVAVLLACIGVLGPLAAALLMPLSSISVVANAYRSRTFREGRSNPSFGPTATHSWLQERSS